MASGKHSAPSSRRASSAGASSAKRRLLPLVIAVVVIALVAVLAVKMCSSGDDPVEIAQGKEVVLTIPDGSTTSDIAQLLKDERLIEQASSFIRQAQSMEADSQLKAGTYRFVGGTSQEDIIKALAAGPTGNTLLVKEGLTAKKIAAEASTACGFDQDQFYALTKKASSFEDEFPFLKGVYGDSLEGFLFPDTYAVALDATVEDAITQMLKNFQVKIAQVDQSYSSSKNLTTYDIVILASMIEKESGSPDDMALISSVFYNRLRAGMNLGSDVTCYYAVGKELGEPLTQSDLMNDSPYNTRNPNKKGLPAGPICNPGLAALTAAAQPQESDYLYFFWSQKEGKTMFFKDYDSFTKAWAKYGE